MSKQTNKAMNDFIRGAAQVKRLFPGAGDILSDEQPTPTGPGSVDGGARGQAPRRAPDMNKLIRQAAISQRGYEW